MELNSTGNAQLQALRHNQRTLTLGLLWGGIMLVILAWWIAVAHAETPRVAVALLAILAVAALGYAVIQLITGRKATPEPQQLDRLHQQRRLVGKLLVGGGLLLVAVGAWLFFATGLAVFGNAVGLVLLGLIAASTGVYQLTTSAAAVDQNQVFERLSQKGILAAVAGLFTRGQPTANSVRVTVLVIGGVIGFLLTLTAFLWAWVWRNDVLFGGLSAWRGEQSWKLWLCAYASLLGLAVMFASLVFARLDIRSDPVFRRVLYGYNTILVGLLLLEFLVVLNVFVYVLYPMNFHWSESRGFYTLSESARDILQKLEKPTKLYVLLNPSILEKDTRSFLDNAQAVTGRLQVKYIAPDKQFSAIQDLAERYQAILSVGAAARRGLGLGILAVYGDEPPSAKDEQPPHAMISVDKIFDVNQNPRTGSSSYSFKGEEVIMSELRFLAEGRSKSKIYFLQGNGEMAIGPDRVATRPAHFPLNALGVGRLFDRLKKENYEVRGLSFGEGKSDDNIEYVEVGKSGKKDIPQDARVLVIAGASDAIPKTTLEAIDRYMKDRKGRMLVLSDVVVKLDQQRKITGMVTTGLEEMLKKNGVDVTNGYIHQLPPIERSDEGFVIRGDPLQVVATIAANDTVLATKFVGQEFDFRTARIVKPLRKAGNFKCETLLEVLPDQKDNGKIWNETDYDGLRDGMNHSIRMAQTGQLATLQSKEPLSVGVTVTETNGTPRLVVIGDAEFASDREIIGRNGTVNFNFLTSALDWLADRPGIGIRPKEGGIYEYPRDVPVTAMVLPPTWLMMLGVIGLGVGVWVVRRR